MEPKALAGVGITLCRGGATSHNKRYVRHSLGKNPTVEWTARRFGAVRKARHVQHIRIITFFLACGVASLVGAACALPLLQSQRNARSGATQEVPTPGPLPNEVPEEFRELWEVWRTLQQDYVDLKALDPKTFARGAISGGLKALDDPYTAYIPVDHYQLQLDELDGSFEGIGAVVNQRDQRIVIVAPLRNSPAERAGIRAGDALLAIDSVPTEGMSSSDAASRIRGKSGTTVTLRVSTGSALPRDVAIERAVIIVPTVTVNRLEGGAVHISLASFGRRTDDDLRRTLAGLDLDETTGIVLDLRNNPGGLLDTAVAVASQFLEDGLVLYEVDRDGAESSQPVRPPGSATNEPLVVLVNRGSASASEVVAGALQARGRAVLVGEKTFGKGSVNVLRRLSSGAGLYVTTARWLTPDRRPIEGIGLQPEVVVQDDEGTSEDEQLLTAVLELKKRSMDSVSSR